jgi:hypothetical protein
MRRRVVVPPTTPAVPSIAYAPNLAVFTAARLMAGVAMTSLSTSPPSPQLTRWWGEDRVRALTVVALTGSLTSTAFRVSRLRSLR